MIQTGKLVESPQVKNSPQPVGPNVLFGPDSTSKYSHVFTVSANEPVFVTGYNIADNDCVVLEHVGGENSGQFFTPVVIGGRIMCIYNHADSVLPIHIPGRYRLRFEGSTPIGAFYVELTK